jgi:hypothetical protein
MRRRSLFPMLMLLLALAAAAEDSLSDWYASSSSAARYESVRGELSAVLAEAKRRKVPEELMIGRLAEGAEKRVPSQRLLAALRIDLENYALVLDMIVRSMPDSLEPRVRLELLERGGVALRSGMDAGIMDEVLAAAPEGRAGKRRAIDALIAVAAADSRVPLGREGKRALALSLVSSTEKDARFSLLSSLFIRGKAAKISARDLVASAVSIFDSGGGFLQLENEITRRKK